MRRRSGIGAPLPPGAGKRLLRALDEPIRPHLTAVGSGALLPGYDLARASAPAASGQPAGLPGRGGARYPRVAGCSGKVPAVIR
jgi:hypothetical protein